MLKFDTSFWNDWKDFSENKHYSDTEIPEGHTDMEKHTITRDPTDPILDTGSLNVRHVQSRSRGLKQKLEYEISRSLTLRQLAAKLVKFWQRRWLSSRSN